MSEIPEEWIDKIFAYMEEFFQEKWTMQFEHPHQLNFKKSQWKNGLVGLDKEEVKKGLKVCRYMGKNNHYPPNVIEFYYYSKDIKKPPPPIQNKHVVPVNKELAYRALNEIKRAARGWV